MSYCNNLWKSERELKGHIVRQTWIGSQNDHSRGRPALPCPEVLVTAPTHIFNSIHIQPTHSLFTPPLRLAEAALSFLLFLLHWFVPSHIPIKSGKHNFLSILFVWNRVEVWIIIISDRIVGSGSRRRGEKGRERERVSGEGEKAAAVFYSFSILPLPQNPCPTRARHTSKSGPSEECRCEQNNGKEQDWKEKFGRREEGWWWGYPLNGKMSVIHSHSLIHPPSLQVQLPCFPEPTSNLGEQYIEENAYSWSLCPHAPGWREKQPLFETESRGIEDERESVG